MKKTAREDWESEERFDRTLGFILPATAIGSTYINGSI